MRDIKKMKTVKTFSWNEIASTEWMLESGHPIDKFMAAAGVSLLNVTRKEVQALGDRFIRVNFPYWNSKTRRVKSSCVFSFMEKHGNLVETGSKLVA